MTKRKRNWKQLTEDQKKQIAHECQALQTLIEAAWLAAMATNIKPQKLLRRAENIINMPSKKRKR